MRHALHTLAATAALALSSITAMAADMTLDPSLSAPGIHDLSDIGPFTQVTIITEAAFDVTPDMSGDAAVDVSIAMSGLPGADPTQDAARATVEPLSNQMQTVLVDFSAWEDLPDPGRSTA